MRFSIKPGTSEALCSRCKNSTVVETRKGAVVTYCSEVGSHYGARVPSDIVKCNNYAQIGTNSEWEFEKVAWLLRSDTSGKIIGFTPPKKKDDD